jgi:aspartate carbamoyltransferase
LGDATAGTDAKPSSELDGPTDGVSRRARRPGMLYDFEGRLERPMAQKISEFSQNGRLQHVIFASQFDPETLERICDLALMIKELSQNREDARYLRALLDHKRAMLYFTQPSTRTFLSFMAACQLLGITCNEIRDPRVSSYAKGESEFDSVRMFSSYFDLIIMRSKQSNLAESCAWLMRDLGTFNKRNVPVINGGSGTDEHPTQALLDMYTVRRSFAFGSSRDSRRRTRFAELKSRHPRLERGFQNKTYCFVGDVGRGRTVRSLATLLAQYEGVKLVFVAPDHPKLRLRDDLRQRLERTQAKVYETDDLDSVLPDVDLVYMTRIQHEHDSPEDQAWFAQTDLTRFHLSVERVATMKEYAPILHPFPRNLEIPVAIDLDPRAMYFRQARNGMWSRAALIATLFDVSDQILHRHRKVFSS